MRKYYVAKKNHYQWNENKKKKNAENKVKVEKAAFLLNEKWFIEISFIVVVVAVAMAVLVVVVAVDIVI